MDNLKTSKAEKNKKILSTAFALIMLFFIYKAIYDSTLWIFLATFCALIALTIKLKGDTEKHKKTIATILTILLFLFIGGKYYFHIGSAIDTKGYIKNNFPDGFTYEIIKNMSDKDFRLWTKLTVKINQKITKGEIDMLSKKLLSDKREYDGAEYQFYIYYVLPGYDHTGSSWAISHFNQNSDLETTINGSTAEQDSFSKRIANVIRGDVIIGKWHEDQYTDCNYVLLRKKDKIFMEMTYCKDSTGEIGEEEIDTQKIGNEIRYSEHHWIYKYFSFDTITNKALYSDTAKDGYLLQSQEGEYYTINPNGELLFSDRESVNYAKGTKF